MARITLSSHLKPYTGGETEFSLDVHNVRQLFQALGERYPELRGRLVHRRFAYHCPRPLRTIG